MIPLITEIHTRKACQRLKKIHGLLSIDEILNQVSAIIGDEDNAILDDISYFQLRTYDGKNAKMVNKLTKEFTKELDNLKEYSNGHVLMKYRP